MFLKAYIMPQKSEKEKELRPRAIKKSVLREVALGLVIARWHSFKFLGDQGSPVGGLLPTASLG